MGGNGFEMNGIDEQNENIWNRERVNALIHSSSIINNCCNHVLKFSSPSRFYQKFYSLFHTEMILLSLYMNVHMALNSQVENEIIFCAIVRAFILVTFATHHLEI